MAHNVYSTFAASFYELGYNVIPVTGKFPVTKGWSHWSKHRMSQMEFDQLVAENMSRANGIGVVCGLGVVAIDIDIDNHALIDQLPPTPMKKFGKKGVTAFYRVDGEWRSRRDTQVIPVELLAVGAQTVMPPSIYPGLDIKNASLRYQWVGESDGPVDISELPLVPDPHALYETLKSYCVKHSIVRDMRALQERNPEADRLGTETAVPEYGVGNRNNFLSKVAYAIACDMYIDHLSEEQAAMKLLEVDRKVHGARAWFDDKEETKGKSAEDAAREFFHRAYKKASLDDEIIEFNLTIEDTGNPEIEVPDNSVDTPKFLYKRATTQEWQDLINEVPILLEFAKFLHSRTPDYSPCLAMGAGLSLLSILSSNIYEFNGIRTNLYAFNIAPTGFGKTAPQQALHQLLMATPGGEALLGFESYRSAQAIYTGLNQNSRHARIDIQDEVGELFVKAADKNNSTMSTAPDVMAKLFTSSATTLGKQAKIKGDKNDSQIVPVSNPFVTWFASTTPSGFRSFILNQAIVSKGLAGRVLYFIEDRDAILAWRDMSIYSASVKDPPPHLINYAAELLSLAVDLGDTGGGVLDSTTLRPIKARPIRAPKDVADHYSTLVHEKIRTVGVTLLREVRDVDPFAEEPPMARILGQGPVLFAKLCALYWLGHGRWAAPLNRQAVDWAYRVYEASLANVEYVLASESHDVQAIRFQKSIENWLMQHSDRYHRGDNLKAKVGYFWKKIIGRQPTVPEIDGYFKSLLNTGVIADAGHDKSGRRVYSIPRPELQETLEN